jgi:hypothetical protein
MWRFLEKPHATTSQKTAFFIVTDVKTTNLLRHILFSSFPEETEEYVDSAAQDSRSPGTASAGSLPEAFHAFIDTRN